MRLLDEQAVLAVLLLAPEAHRWELDELRPEWFTAAHRPIVAALCRVRDSGRRVHWRRVRRALGKGGSAALVEPLVWALGTTAGFRAHWGALMQANGRRAA